MLNVFIFVSGKGSKCEFLGIVDIVYLHQNISASPGYHDHTHLGKCISKLTEFHLRQVFQIV